MSKGGEKIKTGRDVRIGNAKSLIGDIKDRLDLPPATPKSAIEILGDAEKRLAIANRDAIKRVGR